MSTNFPTGLDTYVNPTPGDEVESALIGNMADAVEALEAKVGVDGSAVTSSLDYRVEALENAGGGVSPLLGAVANFDRLLANTAGSTMATGLAEFMGLVSPISMTVNNLTHYNQLAGSAVTTFKMALYSMASNGDITRIGITANSTGDATATGKRTIALTSPVNIVAGQAYAVGILFVGTTGPNPYRGTTPITGGAVYYGCLPYPLARKSSETDLGTSYLFSALAQSSGAPIYVELT